jgi:hypothetical protein
VEVEVQGTFQYAVQKKLAGERVSYSDKRKPAERAKDPYSQKTLQRAYQGYEQGSTHIAVTDQTG